jgi:HTH-type transcriptional regulator, sugar sensing transcriptional regulator
MIQKILSELGFSPNEAKIYESLLDLKEAGVGEISLKAEVHRRNVYDALNRLVDKGLVFPVLTGGENLYCPVDPDKLMEIVREKETELNKILPTLRTRYQKKIAFQEAYIYRGIEGFKNYMLDVARVGKDVYVVGGKLGWLDPSIKNFSNRIIKEINRKKVNFHILFDPKIKEFSEEAKTFGKNPRFLPRGYETDSTINIFGDYVVTYTGLYEKKIDEKGTLFVLKDEQLAESYRKWFKFMWDKCK